MPDVYSRFGTFWLGMPVTVPAPYSSWLPAGTTVTNFAHNLGNSGLVDVTLSNPVTTSSYSGLPIDFGGVINAAPSGTALTFLNGGYANITAFGTGTGGNGTYTIDQSATLAPGSTLYAYDTPGTIYVTGGPRMIQPQELLWSDAVPWGAISAKTYGSTPSKQTVKLAPSNSYYQVSAHVAHASGSGKMWALPSGIYSPHQSDIEADLVSGFAPGLSMVCAADNYRPSTGCGQSYAAKNVFIYNIIGRFVAGNNSGGSMAQAEEYDLNVVADIADLSTVGSTYVGEMLQGPDESSNANVFKQLCSANTTVFGAYASGGDTSSVCNNGMVMDASVPQIGGYWTGEIYGAPWSANLAPWAQQPGISCTGAPTSLFAVSGGVVTHC